MKDMGEENSMGLAMEARRYIGMIKKCENKGLIMIY